MKLRGVVTFAMATQVVVTAALLLASYAMTGTAGPRGFGMAQLIALMASGVVAVLLARLCTSAIETSQAERAAAQLADRAKAVAESAQMTQAVIKTRARRLSFRPDERGIVVE
ncbi:hypothetical protein BRDID11002_82310 [Bradyrhizobium diazoefficiens]